MPFGIYVHVPYCRRVCPYCDFNVYAAGPPERSSEAERLLAASVSRELNTFLPEAPWRGRAVRSIYFGGGTPSLMSASFFSSVIGAVEKHNFVSPDAEVTVEVNPGTIDRDGLGRLKEAGAGRLSIGVQSFVGSVLRSLGRDHSADQAAGVVRDAVGCGFPKVSLDLIFGAPGQTTEAFGEDLRRAVDTGVGHLSLYSLTVEPGTPFFLRRAEGRLPLPDEDSAVTMAGLAAEATEAAGFARYEVSSYARPGHEAVHNSSYWRGDPYLGVGPGAHSYTGVAGPGEYGERRANVASPGEYHRAVAALGRATAWKEGLTRESSAAEHLMLGLRTAAGVSRRRHRELYGEDPAGRCRDTLDRFAAKGLLLYDDERIRLTHAGLLMSDSVCAELSG